MAETVKTFLIPNELCESAGVAVSCRSINKFGLFAYQNRKLCQGNKPTSFAPANISVFNLRQSVILFHPIIRKLVNEANATFLSVQSFKSDSEADRTELIQLSLQYRSIIRACLEDLQDEIKRTEGSEKETLQNYVTIFYSVECVWHLCEILFVDNIPGNVVLPHLLEWIRFHFPKYERNAASLLAGDLIGLESHPNYWQTVIGSLLQGRIEVVRALLRLHSSSDSNPFKLADQILKAMPVYSVYGGLSVSEFDMRWKLWLIDTESKIDAKLFISEEKLNLMMSLIVGKEVAWNEVQVQCEAWYEMLTAWLLYTKPTIKVYELGQCAKRCISIMGIRNHMKHLDRVLLAAMEFDILQVIKEIQYMTENGWFVTHLTDLLFHAGRLDSVNDTQLGDVRASKLRESFLIDYGTLLMGHTSLWQVGLDYLDNCPDNGKATIELLLARLPLTSEAKVNKIIREANKRDLPHIIQSICKIQSVSHFKRKRLGNSLTWALKSQDSAYLSLLADKYLKEYVDKSELLDLELLDNLGSSMLASDRLIFLGESKRKLIFVQGKYCEFHKMYQAKDFKEASKLIIALIGSKLAPKYFSTTLLLDALPLLECDELVLSSNDTFTLLQYLEDNKKSVDMNDRTDVIRLAIARNLGRAFTYENQI